MNTVYDLIASHGDVENMVYFAMLMEGERSQSEPTEYMVSLINFVIQCSRQEILCSVFIHDIPGEWVLERGFPSQNSQYAY